MYLLEFSSPGFKKFVIANLEVKVGELTEFAFGLESAEPLMGAVAVLGKMVLERTPGAWLGEEFLLPKKPKL